MGLITITESKPPMLIRMIAACVALLLVPGAHVNSQATRPSQWTVAAGVALGGGFGIGAPQLTADLALLVATTGPVNWRLMGAVHQFAPFLVPRSDHLVLEADPDTARIRTVLRVGGVMEIRTLPAPLRRVMPFIGAGVYRGSWYGLKEADRDRPAVTTGYRLVGVGVRLRERWSVEITAIDFHNLIHRDDGTMGLLSVRLGVP